MVFASLTNEPKVHRVITDKTNTVYRDLQMANRIKIGTKSALKPGQLLAVTVEQRPLLIANIDGEIYVTDETCTHEDWSLANGALKGDCVECPLHGSRFNLKTGEPLEEPATEPLRTYPAHIEGDDIYIELD